VDGNCEMSLRVDIREEVVFVDEGQLNDVQSDRVDSFICQSYKRV
jgi:hypothetical protein